MSVDLWVGGLLQSVDLSGRSAPECEPVGRGPLPQFGPEWKVYSGVCTCGPAVSSGVWTCTSLVPESRPVGRGSDSGRKTQGGKEEDVSQVRSPSGTLVLGPRGLHYRISVYHPRLWCTEPNSGLK